MPPMAELGELQRTAELLERVRAILERPVLVTSGYRCPALNAAVGLLGAISAKEANGGWQ